MLLLAGRTLLGRAVDTLKAVTLLKDIGEEIAVTVVGERSELEGADRVIVDRFPGCGPLGGIEAALSDLKENGDAEWAFFLPVDMPFLFAGLADALLQEWIEASRRGVRICYVVADERAQPLVSMLHRSVHKYVLEALTAGQLKVTPVLQSIADVMASRDCDELRSCLHTTPVDTQESKSSVAGRNLTGEQGGLRRLWFSNLNDEKELREAETILAEWGSIGGYRGEV